MPDAAAPAPDSGAPAADADRNTALLGSLERTIEATLDPLVPRDRPVALIDFPHAPNVGDSVIWMGSLSFLARRGMKPAYSCSNHTYSRTLLASRVGDGTILLNGGGNFGDLYPSHQALREAVAHDFPRNRVVQLPQTIHFETAEARARARSVFDAHPDFILLVRDQASLALARETFRAPAQLCPDMAFLIGPTPRLVSPSVPVLWLARRDKESAAGAASPQNVPGVHRTDWVWEEDNSVIWLNQRLRRLLRHRPGLRAPLQGLLSSTYAPVARERMRRGMRLIGAGRVVVTNRLHGHILCLLLGIRHVLLDNSYGKVRGFYDAWTRPSPLAEWSDDESDALARARALAGA